ncbi:MAG: hypothetical protein K1X74_11025 [Pirellulales bacterium]|nr:hypothetical protein [Pirellulales bacterium]
MSRLGRTRRVASLKHRRISIEPLEARQLLAVDMSFNDGQLRLDADSASDVEVAVVDGLVKVNGADPTFGELAAASVTKIRVGGGDPNAVNLAPLLHGMFPNLESAVVAPTGRQGLDLLRYERYATALWGEDWESASGLSIEYVQQQVIANTWVQTIDNSFLPAVADFIGPEFFQDWLDTSIAGTDLASIDVTTLKWFQVADSPGAFANSRLAGLPAGKGPADFFEIEGGVAMLLSTVEGTEIAAGEIPGPDPTSGEGGSLEAWYDPNPLYEDDGEVLITVKHSGAEWIEGFNFDWTTKQLTATFDPSPSIPDDYIGHHGNLSWSDSSPLDSDGPEGDSRVFAIPIVDDLLIESDEQFMIEFDEVQYNDPPEDPDAAEGIPTSPPGNLTIQIRDNDSPNAVRISDMTGTEGETKPFVVSLSAPPTSPISVTWVISTNPPTPSATHISDYRLSQGGGATSGGTIVFGVGETSKTIDAELIDDSAIEDTEYFELILTGVSGNATIADDTGLGTIMDNDTPPTVNISDAVGFERDPGDPVGYAVFRVTLSQPFSAPITVIATTRNGNPLDPPAIGFAPGDDFRHRIEYPITFAPNQTEAEFPVEILYNDVPEFDEYFYVDLSIPENVEEGDLEGRGKIIDDDMNDDEESSTDDQLCGCGESQSGVDANNGTSGTSYGGMSSQSDTNPHPIFALRSNIPSTPGRVLVASNASVSVGNLPTVTAYYQDAVGSTATSFRFPLQVDATNLPTGVYDWTMVVTYVFVDAGTGLNEQVFTSTFTGKRVIVNRLNSEFGVRWWVDDLDFLIPDEDGVGVVLGNGVAKFFEKASGNTYKTPASWFDTLIKNIDGSYTLTSPEGERREFSAAGLLQKRVDRNGNETVYSYIDADNDAVVDELSTVVDPFGQVRGYAYETAAGPQFGKIKTTTDHAGRATNWVIDALGRVDRIKSPDPDGPTEPLIQLETVYEYYPTTNLLKKVTPAHGVSTSYEYDAARRVTKIINNDNTFVSINPIQTRNLAFLSGLGSLGSPAPISLAAASPVASITDELLHTSSFTADRFGNSTSWKDPLLHTTTFQRDANGLLTKLTLPDPDGASPGRQATVVDYTYNTKGKQLTEQYGGSPAREWTYDSQYNQVTSFTDELGRKTVYHLDSNGNVLHEQRVVGSQDSLGSITDDVLTSYTYTAAAQGIPAGMVLTMTDGLGRLNEYRYYGMDAGDDATLKGLLKSIKFAKNTADEAIATFEYYSGTRNLKKSIDELGRVTEYFYDNLDRLTKRIDPDPDNNPATNNQPIWQYGYCACGRITSMTDAEGNVTSYTYDNRNRIGTVTLAKPNASDPSNPQWIYTYYDNDLLKTVTDPNGFVTEYFYDNADRLIQVKEPDADGVAGGNDQPIWNYGYDNADLLTSVTDPENRQTTYNYDTRLRTIEVKLPEPSASAGHPTYTYVYDAADQLTEEHAPLNRTTLYGYHPYLGWMTSITEPDADGVAGGNDQPVWSYEYDKLGNLKKLTDPQSHVTDYTYDNRDRLTNVLEPAAAAGGTRPSWAYAYDDASQMTSSTDPMSRTTTYAYDFVGRLKQQTEPDPDGAGSLLAAYTAYTYDRMGNVLSMTDALGHATAYEYDHLFRRTKEIDANNDPTTFKYDFNGNLTQLTDAENNDTTWTYDRLNRVKIETNELNKTRQYQYDRAGNLKQLTDRRGLITEYDYDALDRMTQERWKISGALQHTINYGYDLADRLTTGSDIVATYSYAYDRLDRVQTVTSTLAGLLKTPTESLQVVLGSQYDRAGNRTQLAATLGGTADVTNDYVYDNLDRLKQLKQHGIAGGNAVADKRADFTYNLAGQFDTITRRAGLLDASPTVVTSTYAYDGAGRLTSLSHQKSQPVGALSFVHNFAYDRANRLTAHDDRVTIDGLYYTGRDRDYGYDSRGQLTSVVETIPTPFTVTTQTYAYDKNGNRTATNGVAATIGANNRLTNDGTYSYTYDDEGNLLSRTTIATGARQEYAWDHRNRLAAVVNRPSVGATPTLVEINAYDVFNRRVRRDLDTTGDFTAESRELYVYDGDDVLLDFTDSDANGAALPALARRYLHGPAVDQVLAQENVGGETYWLLGDHLNSTHDLVRWDTAAGRTAVAGHQVYDAFGTPVDQAYLTRYQFTGREYDSATGQQYNRARWYNAKTGRWISEDPIGFAAGDANLNRYVGNAPTDGLDPSGLDAGVDVSGTHGSIVFDVWDRWGNRMGFLRAEFYASGYLGEGGDTICGLGPPMDAWAGVVGKPGRILLTFTATPDNHGVMPAQRIVGSSFDDNRLLDWLLTQIGQNRDWLYDWIYNSNYTDSVLDDSARFNGLGTWSWYNGAYNNCNDFVDIAVDQYVGYDWWQQAIASGNDLKNATKQKFDEHGHRRPPDYDHIPIIW